MADLNLKLIVRMVNQATSPIRKLVGDLGGLKKPLAAAKLFAADFGRTLKIGLLAGAAAAALLAGGLYQVVQRTADAGEAALAASLRTGVSVRSYQRLAYVAKMASTDVGSLDNGLKFLNQSLGAAAAGSKADAEAFRSMGIEIRDSRGHLRDAEAVMFDIADQFSKMEGGARKTTLAMAIFGRSGLDLVPMLNDGSEAMKAAGDKAERMGIVMSEAAAKQADDLNDAIDDLKFSLSGLGTSVAVGLLPQLLQLVKRLNQMIASAKPQIVAKLSEVLVKLTDNLPALLTALIDLIVLLGNVAAFVAPVIEALGGLHTIVDLLAVLMVGRLAFGIWAAVKAIWGLNVAMAANPVGLVIIGVAALIAIVVLLISHWSQVVAFFKGLWPKVAATFKAGANLIWNALPPWMRMILRGTAFAVRFVMNASAPDAATAERLSRPAVQPGRGGLPQRLNVAVTHHSDGRPATVAVSSPSPQITVQPGRGGPPAPRGPVRPR